MSNWKQFITEMVLLFAAVAPLYHLVIQLLRHERNAALNNRERDVRLDHHEDQINDLQNWRSANSGLRLPQ